MFLLFLGGTINQTYGQYRDPSSKKKKKKKRKGKPLFARKSRALKPGESPFAGKKQKKHHSNINDSPFATKSRGKQKAKNKKRKRKKGQAETKPRFSNKRPRKKIGKKEKPIY